MVSAALFPDLEGHWLAVTCTDPRARSLYSRHYSAWKNGEHNRARFVPPCEYVCLLSSDCSALFLWTHERYRHDGQEGVCCSIFRNEGPILSSELIREACDIAWSRWPGTRLFTYVNDAKIRSVNPGACFKKAGWRVCGRNADGRLTILEILPPGNTQPA